MPKNTVTDPITDQESAFAHLILSGTMTDRRAAEAVGLNPDSAAYTKSMPRVRDYMIEHRAAVKEKLVDQEAEGLRKLNIGHDQILNRLSELATLSHEATRGSIAGQMKALAMIAAIEGLILDRRFSPPQPQPTAPPIEADIYEAEWLRKQKHQPVGEEPGDPVAAAKTRPARPRSPNRGLPLSPPQHRLTTRRFRIWTRANPALSIPSSTIPFNSRGTGTARADGVQRLQKNSGFCIRARLLVGP